MSLESIPSLLFPLIHYLLHLDFLSHFISLSVHICTSQINHSDAQLRLYHCSMHKILTVPCCYQIKSKVYISVPGPHSSSFNSSLISCSSSAHPLCYSSPVSLYGHTSYFTCSLTLPGKSLPIIEGLSPVLPPPWRLPWSPQIHDWPIARFFGPYLPLNWGYCLIPLLKCMFLECRNE